jgi:hypothetical protein
VTSFKPALRLEPKLFKNRNSYELLVNTLKQHLKFRPHTNAFKNVLAEEQLALTSCSQVQRVYYYCILANNLAQPSVGRVIEAIAMADCALTHAGSNIKLTYDAIVTKGACLLLTYDDFALVTFERAEGLRTRGLLSSSVNIRNFIEDAKRAQAVKKMAEDHLIPAQRAPMM